MKATMNLNDDLYRRVKIRAAQDGTTVTSLVEQALTRLLSESVTPHPVTKFVVPVLASAGGVLPGVDLGSNKMVQELLDADLPAGKFG